MENTKKLLQNKALNTFLISSATKIFLFILLVNINPNSVILGFSGTQVLNALSYFVPSEVVKVKLFSFDNNFTFEKKQEKK